MGVSHGKRDRWAVIRLLPETGLGHHVRILEGSDLVGGYRLMSRYEVSGTFDGQSFTWALTAGSGSEYEYLRGGELIARAEFVASIPRSVQVLTSGRRISLVRNEIFGRAVEVRLGETAVGRVDANALNTRELRVEFSADVPRALAIFLGFCAHELLSSN